MFVKYTYNIFLIDYDFIRYGSFSRGLLTSRGYSKTIYKNEPSENFIFKYYCDIFNSVCVTDLIFKGQHLRETCQGYDISPMKSKGELFDLFCMKILHAVPNRLFSSEAGARFYGNMFLIQNQDLTIEFDVNSMKTENWCRRKNQMLKSTLMRMLAGKLINSLLFSSFSKFFVLVFAWSNLRGHNAGHISACDPNGNVKFSSNVFVQKFLHLEWNLRNQTLRTFLQIPYFYIWTS